MIAEQRQRAEEERMERERLEEEAWRKAEEDRRKAEEAERRKVSLYLLIVFVHFFKGYFVDIIFTDWL